VGAVLFAAFGLESDDGPTVEEIAGSPEIEGDALPALNPDTDTDPAVGLPGAGGRGRGLRRQPHLDR
jgi:hypothetical protein